MASQAMQSLGSEPLKDLIRLDSRPIVTIQQPWRYGLAVKANQDERWALAGESQSNDPVPRRKLPNESRYG